MLNIRVLLPDEPIDNPPPAHLLILDLRNQGKQPCNLRDFTVHLPTEDGFGYQFGDSPDRSIAAKIFKDAQSRLMPGSEAHQVFAWSSVPQTQLHLDDDGCRTADGFTASLETKKVILDVQHLWLEQCGQVWLSSMRSGAFVPGEELPSEWMARYGLSRRAVAEPRPAAIESAKLQGSASITYLEGNFESGYTGWFNLLLKRPPGVGGRCAIRTLSRREADGNTTVFVSHCESAQAISQEKSKRFFEIMLRDYKMRPTQVGRVEYESSSELVQGGRQVTAFGMTAVEVRDSTDPMLPAIETDRKPCRADQLALQTVGKLGSALNVRSLKPMEEVPRAGRIYTLTNSSKETCLLGGTPNLDTAQQSEAQQFSIGVGACRDCSDTLFSGRGNHWITLAPEQSAHFLVTAKPVYGISSKPCVFVPKLVLYLPVGKVQLEYGLNSCGQIDVSAWREGVYDKDPLNLLYAVRQKKSSDSANFPALPDACAKAVTPETGYPYMFPAQGQLQFGLSSKPSAFRDNAPLAIWVSNPTDKEGAVMSCQDLDGFFIGGFDVLDQSGNRVLAKAELREGVPVGETRVGDYARQLWGCTRNFPIPIPSHSCIHGNLDNASYDFVKNLGLLYTLPAGNYQIVARLKNGEKRISITGLGVEVTP